MIVEILKVEYWRVVWGKGMLSEDVFEMIVVIFRSGNISVEFIDQSQQLCVDLLPNISLLPEHIPVE